jgi:hypothetical protein
VCRNKAMVQLNCNAGWVAARRTPRRYLWQVLTCSLCSTVLAAGRTENGFGKSPQGFLDISEIPGSYGPWAHNHATEFGYINSVATMHTGRTGSSIKSA